MDMNTLTSILREYDCLINSEQAKEYAIDYLRMSQNRFFNPTYSKAFIWEEGMIEGSIARQFDLARNAINLMASCNLKDATLKEYESYKNSIISGLYDKIVLLEDLYSSLSKLQDLAFFGNAKVFNAESENFSNIEEGLFPSRERMLNDCLRYHFDRARNGFANAISSKVSGDEVFMSIREKSLNSAKEAVNIIEYRMDYIGNSEDILHMIKN